MNNENNCNNCIHNIKCHTCIRNASSAGEENNWTDKDMNWIDAKKELSRKPIDTDKIQGCNHHNFTGNIQGCSHSNFIGFPKNLKKEFKRCPTCSSTFQDEEELDAYKLLLDSAFIILLNANDFFGYACADAVELDTCDLTWVIPIVQKHGYTGIEACMAYVEKCKPLEVHQTKEFTQAYKEIEELNPKVWSGSEK